MNSQIIDNEANNTLAQGLEKILPSCDRVDALVGYFYFSGFSEIYQQLQDKKIRILIGMEIDQKVIAHASKMDEFEIDRLQPSYTPAISRTAAKRQYTENLTRIFNDTDWFDKDDAVKAFEVFMTKLKDGSLEIRKTLEPHHAKDYILHYKPEFSQGGSMPGVVITGSSNLTYSGLRGQGERNRILREAHYYQEDVENFEKLWSDEHSVSIANLDNSVEFTEEIKKKVWLYALPTPYLLYLRVLNEYFELEETESGKSPAEITGGKYSNLRYQIDAINLGIDRIGKFGGVIIADVVGLGKSIIASAIAHNLKLKTIIIAPPHLVDQWNEYSFEFDYTAQVFSTGQIEKAFEQFADYDEELLIILDEAHKHRNEDTDNYRLLHRLCQGNKVMALSATPFNNDPKDIYALIKLFDTPGQSTLKTVENISVEFHELFAEYKKIRGGMRKASYNEKKVMAKADEIARRLRKMIEPLVIRRSRLDLMEIDVYRTDLEQQGIGFAAVHDPMLLEYELGELSQLYIDTLNAISAPPDVEAPHKFIGARYKPVAYVNPNSKIFDELYNEEFDSPDDFRQRLGQAQANVAKFMRKLLVRRFESSVYAFQSSLGRMIKSSSQMLDWYERLGEIPIYKKGELPELDDLELMDEEELNNALESYEQKGLVRIPASELSQEFAQDLRNDIALLKALENQWFSDGIQSDPKFDMFIEHIRTSLAKEPRRKIIVFSEFSDTAQYVYERMKEYGLARVFKYSSSDSSKDNKEIIRKNFDAGLDVSKQGNDFDILVATDAISEGFNLHRAGTIINYDIPYNPTRVIQRIGRINRINKKVFEQLYVINAFPTATGEAETNTKKISRLKINLIHALLGEDSKVLTSDEELRNFFAQQYREENAKFEELSWDAPHRKLWLNLKNDKDLFGQVQKIPHRTRIARKSKDRCVVVFGRRGANSVFALGKDGAIELIAPEIALQLFVAEMGEKAYETSSDFDPIYQEVKKHLFKNNTHPPIRQGSRRHEAVQKLTVLSQLVPKSKDYCDDTIRIIAELDSLPDGVQKDIAQLDIKSDPEEAYQTLRELIPEKYIDDINKTAKRSAGDEELVVLTEEHIA